MKRLFFSLPIFISLVVSAQNTPSVSPPTTTSPAAPTGNTTRSPANPTQPGPFTLRSQNITNAVTGPVLTNNFGAAFTNQFGTNIMAANVASSLLVLQSDLLQALQLLAAFNGSANVQATANNALSSGVPASGVNDGVNFAQNNAVNFAQNNGVNFATSLATPTVAQAATPPSVFAPPTNTPVPPGAFASPPTASNVVGGASVSGSTNAFANFPANGGSAQLFILQRDIQRLVAEINAITGVGLNAGGSAPGSATVTAGQLESTSLPDNSTNTGTPRIITRQSTPRTLTPTGR